jgi:predicted TIM-barrel fold metal-dependent hydrolase
MMRITPRNGDLPTVCSTFMVQLVLAKCNHSHLTVDIMLMTRDKHGVGMMVLSITSPGCQGEADQEKSEALAKRANDYMADIVSKNPTRFQGFASVSMHDPAEAAQELTRAVKKLGLKGCMLNDCEMLFERKN